MYYRVVFYIGAQVTNHSKSINVLLGGNGTGKGDIHGYIHILHTEESDRNCENF